MNYKYVNNNNKNTFILLHGTGGTMEDLIPIAKYIDSFANILSLEGHILEGPHKRYFKRLGMGILDEESLEKESYYVENKINELSRKYNFDLNNIYFIGYSNGANLISSMLYLNSKLVKNAILFNAMVPYKDKKPTSNISANILLTGGKFDNMIPIHLTEGLSNDLTKAGAEVTFHLTNQGHQISESNIRKAKEFYEKINK